MRKRTFVNAAIIAGGALAGIVGTGAVAVALLGYTLYDLRHDDTLTLPPCVTEDSDNCYWDASAHGNRLGTSFIVIDGVVFYPEAR